MAPWSGRIWVFLSDNTEYLLAGFVVVALFGGFLAYEPYVDPGTEVEEFEKSNWSSTAAFTHQANVTEETDVFEAGTVLRDRPSYLESISPVLDGTFTYEYEASSGGELSVDANLTLILRSAGEETEYWREESTLSSVTEASVRPGEEVAVPFSVNVTETKRRIAEIEDQLDGTPGETEIIVAATLERTGERNGQQVSKRTDHRTTIDSEGNVYSVTGADPDTDSGQQFGQETVEASYGPLRTVSGPALVVVGLLGVVGLAVGRSQGWFSVPERRREWLTYQGTRSEFDEWITDGEVPGEVMERTVIEVDSLEGLVDVAIDSDRRVIADRSRGICVVVLDDALYRFVPPDPP